MWVELQERERFSPRFVEVLASSLAHKHLRLPGHTRNSTVSQESPDRLRPFELVIRTVNPVSRDVVWLESQPQARDRPRGRPGALLEFSPGASRMEGSRHLLPAHFGVNSRFAYFRLFLNGLSALAPVCFGWSDTNNVFLFCFLAIRM